MSKTLTDKQREIRGKRYTAKCIISVALIGAIGDVKPNLTYREAQEIYEEWTRDEDGAIAMTQLVNLIIY